MRFYIAEVCATGIAFLCALLNHAGGCFVWRRLFWRLDSWATEVMRENQTRVTSVEWAPSAQSVMIADQAFCVCGSPYTAKVNTCASAGTGSWKFCPVHQRFVAA